MILIDLSNNPKNEMNVFFFKNQWFYCLFSIKRNGVTPLRWLPQRHLGNPFTVVTPLRFSATRWPPPNFQADVRDQGQKMKNHEKIKNQFGVACFPLGVSPFFLIPRRYLYKKNNWSKLVLKNITPPKKTSHPFFFFPNFLYILAQKYFFKIFFQLLKVCGIDADFFSGSIPHGLGVLWYNPMGGGVRFFVRPKP